MLASFIFHSGYNALDRKNIGKITKFITPAKFSNCLIKLDNINPSAPKKNAIKKIAGIALKYPNSGISTSTNWAKSKKITTCKSDNKALAINLQHNK